MRLVINITAVLRTYHEFDIDWVSLIKDNVRTADWLSKTKYNGEPIEIHEQGAGNMPIQESILRARSAVSTYTSNQSATSSKTESGECENINLRDRWAWTGVGAFDITHIISLL